MPKYIYKCAKCKKGDELSEIWVDYFYVCNRCLLPVIPYDKQVVRNTYTYVAVKASLALRRLARFIGSAIIEKISDFFNKVADFLDNF